MEPRSHSSVISLSTKESKDIAEFRVYLEDFAIDHIDEDSLKSNMETICKYASDCQYAFAIGNRAKAFELDSLFHLSLIGISNNTAMIDVYERLDAKIQLLRLSQNEQDEKLSSYLQQHMTLIEFLKKGKKEEAKSLLYDHIMHNIEKE